MLGTLEMCYNFVKYESFGFLHATKMWGFKYENQLKQNNKAVISHNQIFQDSSVFQNLR